MISSLTLPIEMFSQPTQIHSAIGEISHSPAIALDIESNSFHRYPEQLCLIQIADRHKIYIIDTISLKELGSLKKVFEDNSITKVLHSADNDIRSIDRHHGVRIRNIYDVRIAAVFSGIQPFNMA